MRFVDRLLSKVDMSAQKRTVEVEGEEFEFYVTPLTAAERARALKEAGSGSESAQKFGIALIVQKCRDENGQALFSQAEAVKLRNDMPASVIDALMTAVIGNTDEEEEEEEEPKSKARKAAR